jgi:hypothetical protein
MQCWHWQYNTFLASPVQTSSFRAGPFRKRSTRSKEKKGVLVLLTGLHQFSIWFLHITRSMVDSSEFCSVPPPKIPFPIFTLPLGVIWRRGSKRRK